MFNEVNLPSAAPTFDVLFALNCGDGLCVLLEPDELFKVVATGEPLDRMSAMFVSPPHKVICDARIKCSVWFVGHHINEHRVALDFGVPRVKPEDDEQGGERAARKTQSPVLGLQIHQQPAWIL